MFTVIRTRPDRLDIDFSGKLDADEMRRALDELIREGRNIENGRMLYRIRDFDPPSLGAVAVELSRFPELLSLMRRFDRAAVLADADWVRKVGEIEGKLIPGLEIKAFDLDERAKAEDWLGEAD